MSSKAQFQRAISHALSLADLVHAPPLDECDEVAITLHRPNTHDTTSIVVKTSRRDVEVGDLIVRFDTKKNRKRKVVYVQPVKS